MQPTEQVERDINRFLMNEAQLLDRGHYRQWLDLLTQDIVYQMPARVTTCERSAGSGFDSTHHFDEDRASLEMRVRRIETEYAWAEEPPTRTRRFVNNVRVEAGANQDEVVSTANVLIFRSRGDSANHVLLSMERADTLRRVEGQWQLARRVMLVDQSNLPVSHISVIL